jgi:hypothetical protein
LREHQLYHIDHPPCDQLSIRTLASKSPQNSLLSFAITYDHHNGSFQRQRCGQWLRAASNLGGHNTQEDDSDRRFHRCTRRL